MFNLLQLHDKEKDKNIKSSWIKARGKNLNKITKAIIEGLIKSGATKQIIILELSKRWNCHFSTAKRHFYISYKESRWIALSFLTELVDIWKIWLKKSNLESKKIKSNLISSIEFLKVGQNNSKPIIAVKELDVEICKFLGAFAADGCLDKKWRINISDQYLETVKKAQKWFENSFGAYGNIRKAKGNWWEFEIYSKVVGRYLNVIFGFPIGKKSRVVDEPNLIKKSDTNFRKAFAAGVLNFDGSISINGSISLESYSNFLINSMEDILKLCKIKTYKSLNGLVLRICNPSIKCLEYFEKKTEKRKRLEIILGLRKEIITNPTMERILDFILSNKFFDLKQIAEAVGLKKNSMCAYTKILRNCKIIKPSQDISEILEKFYTSNGIYVILNKDVRDKLFVGLKTNLGCNSYVELSNKLDIPHTTTTRWALGQNGIPIKQLKKFYKILNWKIREKDVHHLQIRGENRFYKTSSNSAIRPLGSISTNA